VVAAYMVGEAMADERDSFCLKSIARFKRTKDCIFIDALPHSARSKRGVQQRWQGR